MSVAAGVIAPFAHFGHWYISAPVYFAPVALLALYVTWSSRRDRRREQEARGERAPARRR